MKEEDYSQSINKLVWIVVKSGKPSILIILLGCILSILFYMKADFTGDFSFFFLVLPSLLLIAGYYLWYRFDNPLNFKLIDFTVQDWKPYDDDNRIFIECNGEIAFCRCYPKENDGYNLTAGIGIRAADKGVELRISKQVPTFDGRIFLISLDKTIDIKQSK